MHAVFLSASIPIAGRGDFYKTASPFLIQCAVQEFLVCTLGRRLIVWGGHPAITPMVWAACESLGISYAEAVVLYQSRFFEDSYPEENAHFKNVIETPAVVGDRQRSLQAMRQAMLSRKDLSAAVFIGGMEGVFDEYAMFTKFHPKASVLTVPASGGAARELAKERGQWNERATEDLNFARLFHEGLRIEANEPRLLTATVSQDEQGRLSGGLTLVVAQRSSSRAEPKLRLAKAKKRSRSAPIGKRLKKKTGIKRAVKKSRIAKRKK
jgi:hypothetical protein